MPSFDVVSEVDIPEVENALEQTRREVGQRYDFKGSKTEIAFPEKKVIQLVSDDDYKVNAVVEILQGKLAKRQVSLKSLEYGKVEPSAGGLAKQTITVHQGLEKDDAKEIVKMIKASKLKVQAQLQERAGARDREEAGRPTGSDAAPAGRRLQAGPAVREHARLTWDSALACARAGWFRDRGLPLT